MKTTQNGPILNNSSSLFLARFMCHLSH
jgi:hypothetical protein